MIGDSEAGKASPFLTSQVAGRMENTFAVHVRRLGILISEEQEKPLPNNALIAVLCDSIRLAREAMAVIADNVKHGGNTNDLDRSKQQGTDALDEMGK